MAKLLDHTLRPDHACAFLWWSRGPLPNARRATSPQTTGVVGRFLLFCFLLPFTTASNGAVVSSYDSGDSSFFFLDTRVSTGSTQRDSGLFTVNTRSTIQMGGEVRGMVRALGAPLPGVTVQALRDGQVLASAETDMNGVFALRDVPTGSLRVQASRSLYSQVRSAVHRLESGRVLELQFELRTALAPPTLVSTARVVEPTQEPRFLGTANPQLWVWEAGAWITNRVPQSDRMTVVLTHGMLSSAKQWPQSMAPKIAAASDRPVNIVAWDWESGADHRKPPVDEAVRQGRQAGKALYAGLGANYRKPLHFIGHSLGTIVNRYAADYVHGDAPKEKDKPSVAWSSRTTHTTALDEAELASLAGDKALLYGALTYTFTFNAALALITTVNTAASEWRSPVPNRRLWMDNYISLVGLPHPDVVNIYLLQSPQRTSGLVGAHGYAHEWYGESINEPSASAVGFNNTLEAHAESAFIPIPRSGGSVLRQKTYPSNALELTDVQGITDLKDMHRQMLGQLLRNKGSAIGSSIADQIATVGKVGVDTVQTFINQSESLASASLSPLAALNLDNDHMAQIGEWSTRFKISSPSGALRALAATPVPSALWMRQQVPSNITSISFDFLFAGDLKDDVLLFGVNGTNVMSFNADLFANDIVHNSSLIDVSAWAGKEVEFFFGLRDGGGTNGSVAVQNILLHEGFQPTLAITQAGNGKVKLTWFAGAGLDRVEVTRTLDAAGWEQLGGTAVLTNLNYEMETQALEPRSFYRSVASPPGQ